MVFGLKWNALANGAKGGEMLRKSVEVED